MADPTITAYGRVNRLGTPRPLTPTSPITPGYDVPIDDDYFNKFPIWTKIRDCYDGAEVVKAAGERYLPKLAAHSPADYTGYKDRASFYNAVRRTHRGLMGSLFRKPTEFTLPDKISSKIDVNRITLDCQSLEDFDKDVAHEVLLVGRYGILADFKANQANKPYLVGYTAENIISFRLNEFQGRRVVDRVILTEYETTLTEFGSTVEPIIRVLRLDPRRDGGTTSLVYSQTILRPAASGTIKPRSDVEIKMFGRTLDYIPFVFVNATNLKPDVQFAPLEDIASINVDHYKASAHLAHGRFYAGMPTYVTAGDNSTDLLSQIAAAGQTAQPPGTPPDPRMQANALTVGPQFVWNLEKDAKAWLLEFTGHGLTFLENAIDTFQLQMQSLGGRLVSSTRRAAALSDEAWRLLESGDEATLMDVSITLDHALNRAIGFLADILGLVDDPLDSRKNGIQIEHNKEFTPSELTARELRALQALAERAHIPQEVMYYALREVGVIPVEYTLEDFVALMKRKDQIWEPPVDPNAPPGSPPGVRPNPAPKPANTNPPSGTSE